MDWFWDLLLSWGLWKKDATVLLLGLDNAGKTTLLNKLKTGKIGRFTPTQRVGTEDVEIGNVRLRAHDLGGHKAARNVWEDYFTATDALIYMVDLGDEERLAEAAEGLWTLLETKRETPLDQCVLLVLGNKADRPVTMELEAVQKALRLEEASTHFKAVASFRVSLYTMQGYQEALKWLEINL